jgi:hypothetical protein
MARKKKSRPSKLKRWTSADVKLLRQHAGKKDLSQIARALKRTPAAIRLKASGLRVSLRQR